MSFIRNLKRNNWLMDSLFLTISLLVFYSLWLGYYPVFTPDEGRYSEIAREMIVSKDYITPRVNGIVFLDKPILYYWFQSFSIHFFGIKEWSLRLFPMLLGILGCLVTYICGRYLFDRRTGLIAVGILATTPLYFGTAHYADLNLEVAVFISCTLLLFITAIQTKSFLRHYLFISAYICAALACLTKGLIGIAFPAMVIFSWILLLRNWSMLKKIHLIKGLLLFLLLVLPWYILVHQANPHFLHYFFITQQVTRFISGATFNNTSPIWFYIPIVIVGFYPWTIFLFQALFHHIHNSWRAARIYQVELFLLLWVGVIFIFFSIPHSKTIGYILPIFPALSLLVGRYLDHIWDKLEIKNGCIYVVSFIFLSIIFSILLFALPHYHWLDFANKLNAYLVVIGCVLLASSLLAVLNRASLLRLIMICLSCNIICLLLLTHGATYLNLNSAKPLIFKLKKILQPQNEVITYFKYYQDVPLYLGQQTQVVANWNAPDIARKDNWVREFWFGIPFQNTSKWLIDEDTFWQRFESKKRVFVFLNDNYFTKFKNHAKNYFILGQNNDIILLSNQSSKNPQLTRNKSENRQNS